MTSIPRFECASSSVRLKGLLSRTRRVLWTCLGLGIAAHLLLTQIRTLQTEQKAIRPLTTQFVKRQPRLTKPLELKKRPQPKRRPVQRTMVSVKARMQHDQRGVRFEPAQVLGGLARPDVSVGRIGAFAEVQVEPTAIAEGIEGSKEAEQKVDMSLELLDIEALDTGKYHALVVQDPEDKKAIEGFCYLAIADLPAEAFAARGIDATYTFEMYVVPGLSRVPAAMNEYTQIKTKILGRLSLHSAELFRAPWLFAAAHRSFNLSDSELQNFGKYLICGGFAFADGAETESVRAWKGGVASLRNCLLDALRSQGVEALLEKLPNSHPIYHCYFDFSGPPVGADAAEHSMYPDLCRVIPYLEGLHAEHGLVAILSRKNYAHAWTFWGPGRGWSDWDPKRPLQFAVNTIVFALTQEGSITRRLMDSIQ